jgi:hypothetical protein
MLVDAIQERQQLVLVYLGLVVAFDLVQPQSDVGDFGIDGINGCIRPAAEAAHRLGSIDALGAGGPIASVGEPALVFFSRLGGQI